MAALRWSYFFQEELGVVNDVSAVFKLRTVGDNQRDSLGLVLELV